MLSDRLVAHRGYQKKYPENSLLGLSKAIEAGAHFLELDIQFSADHAPLLYHDPMMRRISDMHQLISQLTLEQALDCPAFEPQRLGDTYQDEKIGSLAELVNLLLDNPHVNAFVELKSEAVEFLGIEKSYTVIDELLNPVVDQAILISFHAAFIQHVKQRAKYRTGIVAHAIEDLTSTQTKQLAPDYVFCDKELLPEGNLADYPFILVVYEVDQPAEAQALFERGVDMVETFDIGGLLQDLGHMAL